VWNVRLLLYRSRWDKLVFELRVAGGGVHRRVSQPVHARAQKQRLEFLRWNMLKELLGKDPLTPYGK
jgi:hypothetical protein